MSTPSSATVSPTSAHFPSTTTTPPNDPTAAYATLITSPSYLPGAILLAHTLKKHGSQFPLVLMYANLPADYLPALEREALRSNIILHPTPLLNLSANSGVAARFASTWTKLQVFSLYTYPYERICFLDADILIFGPMDELLFKHPLRNPSIPGEAGKLLAANHVCVCNLENDTWAPESWTRENCAYVTPSPNPVEHNPPVPSGSSGPQTHTLLNSGVFIFAPSKETWDDMWKFIDTHQTELSSYQFPDQDFITEWWRDRWVSVGWKWNALKTWRYWHPEMWRDEEVRALHYIVDKPWSKRVGADGVAGYKGNDGVTHGWWWDAYGKWEEERKEAGEMEILKVVGELVD
ncbi:uncharacterized protein EAF02_010450 [Botrytis sinoallii]|uniref:uncharacterized protein n=1 Tax=Botrytis sinoallii TaxID=1463999 RepID=UPI001901C336|nr:uncharacterized protein EAF02_010450 [Botrytis sinoallii]KAF7862901.1 hypothetical protein EAF02_010450 [Botrytis sinoallii]